MNKDRKKLIKNITRKDINTLFSEAEKAEKERKPDRVKRYLQLVWAFVKKNKVKLTNEQKGGFCKKCFKFLHDEQIIVNFNRKINAFKVMCKDCGYTRILKE